MFAAILAQCSWSSAKRRGKHRSQISSSLISSSPRPPLRQLHLKSAEITQMPWDDLIFCHFSAANRDDGCLKASWHQTDQQWRQSDAVAASVAATLRVQDQPGMYWLERLGLAQPGAGLQRCNRLFKTEPSDAPTAAAAAPPLAAAGLQNQHPTAVCSPLFQPVSSATAGPRGRGHQFANKPVQKFSATIS